MVAMIFVLRNRDKGLRLSRNGEGRNYTKASGFSMSQKR